MESKVKHGALVATTLSEEDKQEIRTQCDICKLNGWSFEDLLEYRLHRRIAEDWQDLCREYFDKADPKVEVGMGATEVLYTDKRAMTIVKVISPKKIVVHENETECIDYWHSEYKILDTLAEYHKDQVFTQRRNGQWVEEGQPNKRGSVRLIVGFRAHYIDPNF